MNENVSVDTDDRNLEVGEVRYQLVENEDSRFKQQLIEDSYREHFHSGKNEDTPRMDEMVSDDQLYAHYQKLLGS